MNSYSGMEPRELQELREAKAHIERDLFRLPGVHAVGVGYKEVGGTETQQLAIVVLVDRKLSKSQLDPRERVPEHVTFTSSSGREVTARTDVQEAARPAPIAHVPPAQLRTKVRPSPGGVAIASPVGSGTLGGWAIDGATGRFVFISNRHVLGTTVGAMVMQPFYPMPGDTNDYRFGTVLRASSTYDATIGEPLNRADVKTEIFGNGPAIYEVAQATVGMQVEKTGVQTGHTEGRVHLIDVTTTSPCVSSRTAFRIIPTQGTVFVLQGDSGSVIAERTHPQGMNWKRIVGLLYCGTTDGSAGYAHQTTDVFADLGLRTVCQALASIIDAIFRSTAAPGVLESHDFARDVEVRLAVGAVGREIVQAVRAHRASAVELILDGDGRRALEAALHPLLAGSVVTDDLLDRVVSDEDAARLARLIDVAERLMPDEEPMLRRAREILERTRNQRLRSVLLNKEE